MGISRTAYRRWSVTSSSARLAWSTGPASQPQPSADHRRVEQRILGLGRRQRLGPARIAARLGLPASTVHRVLVRHGCNRLVWLDRPTGRPIRRYEHLHPGDLVHLDTNKLGRIPHGGGHRVQGRAAGAGNRRADQGAGGYDYLHAAVDDHSRLADVEVLGDERAQICARFWRRAHHWFALHGVSVTRVLTDNGVGYRSRLFGAALAATGVRHQRIRPYRPQTNGRWSGSTGPCSRRGRIGGCTGLPPPATVPCSPGSTGTTCTAPTPPSAAGATDQPHQQPPWLLHLGRMWVQDG
jgi:hypothetical protein